MENGNQPAFAQSENWQNDMEKHISKPTQYLRPSIEGIGLTKREYFAGLAMQGMLSNSNFTNSTNDLIAIWSIQLADSLLEQLNKQ